MLRVLEPELMEDAGQVFAYAQADFNRPHSEFIRRIKTLVKNPDFNGKALDLGCGPGDISCRFIKAFPSATLDAIDGSRLMIDFASNTIDKKLLERLNFIHGKIPETSLPNNAYEIIFSNSLLHHLPDPQVLWHTIKQYSKSGTYIAIMDLVRPGRTYLAKTLVDMYASSEPEVLQQDFYNSLLAAFSLEEITNQLAEADLPLSVEKVSDRHVFISGVIA
ncbi:MAG: class I SAM-dependent methyltransferase [Methylococcaceae bacterium]|nr:class I SAM-dependent methyltransferase [Methylococcaceae bacterium]